MSTEFKTLPNESYLFAQIAKGDEAAFEEIFHHYNKRIYPFILKRTKSATITEEIVQDIFIKLWVNRETLTEIQNYQSYIFSMATNMGYNYLRNIAGESRRLKELWNNVEELRNMTEEAIDFKESEELVNKAVDQLSPQRKKIYLLSRREGLNHEQIAKELDISKKTVNNILTEALRSIREYIRNNTDNSLPIVMILLRILK